MANDCESKIGFLVRKELYDTVKPYDLRFDPPDSTPRHNIEIETCMIKIRDARQLGPTLETHGFCVTQVPTAMQYDDFADPTQIEGVYAPELQQHLQALCGARHTRVIDYAVRRRHPDFPISTGRSYENQQPAALAHLDFAHAEGIKMLKTLYGSAADEILRHRWSIVNVWRPLRGPLYDWPLAVCDARSFDPERDAQVSDAVWPDWAYENVLIHARPEAQEWYYFPRMLESETMVFRCTDSELDGGGGELILPFPPSSSCTCERDSRAGESRSKKVCVTPRLITQLAQACPHAAFQNPHAPSHEKPRESIESRVFLMWAPMEKLPEEVGQVLGSKS